MTYSIIFFLKFIVIKKNFSRSFKTDFVFFLVDGFAQAATSFAGQNYGAGQLDRCRKSTRMSIGLGIVFGGVLAGIFMLIPRVILGLYSSDPVILDMAVQRAYIVLPFVVFNVIYGSESGALRAYGYSTIPAVITVFCAWTFDFAF